MKNNLTQKRLYSAVITLFLLANIFQLAGCKTQVSPVHYLQLFDAKQEIPPGFAVGIFDYPPEPYRSITQITTEPGDEMYFCIVMNRENKHDILFTKYTFFNTHTNQETEITNTDDDIGPFTPGQITFVAHPKYLPVPDQPGNYEFRIYLEDKVVASAVFEVRKHNPVESIGISRYKPDELPDFGPIRKETPFPDFIQESFDYGNTMYFGIVLNSENTEPVIFSKYTFFNQRTKQETETGTPEELGPFAPGQMALVAYTNPWPVPEEPDTYEFRIYLDEIIVASALFEVK